MKRLGWILVATMLAWTSIANRPKVVKKNDSKRKQTIKNKSNYENNSFNKEFFKKSSKFQKKIPNEWKYLGDKPALLIFMRLGIDHAKKWFPILEELAAEYDGQIYIYKVDTEQEQRAGRCFGIQSIP